MSSLRRHRRAYEKEYGPKNPISQDLHATKYRAKGEDFRTAMYRIAGPLSDGQEHHDALADILLNQKFLPAGRVQSAIGSVNEVTAFNCFVSNTIPDSMRGIMEVFTNSALTQRQGGGIGYDFSTIRPNGTFISTLNAPASGPISFMDIGDAVCGTVSSAGNRRGAQMAVLRIDHPDIEEFITAKNNDNRLTRYNMSVAVTDDFMNAYILGDRFPLMWEGKVVRYINARNLWDKIMRSTWDWAEPGILFIDTINKNNNLYYCETIACTNPCGEQPLPPNGACLLGSWNLTKYLLEEVVDGKKVRSFNYTQLIKDIPVVVRAMDKVIDVSPFPLPEQKAEAESKRRMGLGYTGLANAIEFLGHPYASDEFLLVQEGIQEIIMYETYRASITLAKEKGPFPLFYREDYLNSEFIKKLPKDIRDGIEEYGIRNSHLLSIAPTGTISFCADNVSSGIEPVFSYAYDRVMQTTDGPVTLEVTDYAYREYGVKGRKTSEVSPEEHLKVLASATKFSDSAVSKTCNIGDDVTWEEFKDVYVKAWKMGAKGVTTFRAAGKRFGILVAKDPEEETGQACFIDPETGQSECG